MEKFKPVVASARLCRMIIVHRIATYSSMTGLISSRTDSTSLFALPVHSLTANVHIASPFFVWPVFPHALPCFYADALPLQDCSGQQCRRYLITA